MYMGNLLLFLSSLIHYLWALSITVVLILIACFVGIKWRKSKDAKTAEENRETNEVSAEAK